MTLRPERNRFDRALQELQVTLNIARRNSLEDESDTWVLFSDQYLDVVRAAPCTIRRSEVEGSASAQLW